MNPMMMEWEKEEEKEGMMMFPKKEGTMSNPTNSG
jgi:hypothetical protein